MSELTTSPDAAISLGTLLPARDETGSGVKKATIQSLIDFILANYFIKLTQLEYDALSPPNDDVYYFIEG